MTSQQINSGGERGEKPHPCINRKDGPPNFKRWSELSSKVINVLSVLALLSVLSGYTHPAQPPQTDEGAAAHIFQLSIVGVALSILVFLASADWEQPLRSVRPLAFPAGALVLAFGALYYLEHLR
jgi:hypothetical protein